MFSSSLLLSLHSSLDPPQTRPLGLLALSQALSAANDEVDALRSVVKDVTSLVHAQAQDAFAQAQLQHQQQKQHRRGRVGREGDDEVGLGGCGLSDREIDELSGSEARELLKVSVHPISLLDDGLSLRRVDPFSSPFPSLTPSPSLSQSLTTPPPSQIPSSLALIKHLHHLASNTNTEGEASESEEDEEIFSDANLMRLAEVVEGWKRG